VAEVVHATDDGEGAARRVELADRLMGAFAGRSPRARIESAR